MATENIITGKKYRVMVDAANKIWQRISFWTKASDVEFNDGGSAEEKVGIIDGITSDVNGESDTIAASIKAVNEINNNLVSSLQNVKTYVGEDGLLHFIDSTGADSVLPFKNGCAEMGELTAKESGTRSTINFKNTYDPDKITVLIKVNMTPSNEYTPYVRESYYITNSDNKVTGICLLYMIHTGTAKLKWYLFDEEPTT